MLRTTHLQNIDLWEAWIEFDQTHPEYFGTLYIAGEIETPKKPRHPFIIKKEENPTLSKTLVLHVDLDVCSKGSYGEEVRYSEPLTAIDQYTSVVIYANNEIIMVLRDIEVMI